MTSQRMQQRQMEEGNQEKEESPKAKARVPKEDHIHGAQDPKEVATIVEDLITRGNAHRMPREVKQRAKVIHIQHRGSGQDGTQGSDQSNGRICAQEIPKVGEKGKE